MGFLNLLFSKNKKYFRISISIADKKIVEKKWSEIKELVKLGGPSRFRSSIINADKLLDFVLGKMGYQGSLGEKLKMAKDKFVEDNNYSIYNGIWEAHKTRNKVVHEVSYELLSHEAYDAIHNFENGFKKLGVL